MRFDQLSVVDVVLAIVIGAVLLVIGDAARGVLRHATIAPVVPAAVVVAPAPATPPIVNDPPVRAPAVPPPSSKPTRSPRPARIATPSAAPPRAPGPGDEALHEALAQYAGGNFEAALQSAEQAIGLGAKAALRIAAMSACKLGQRELALRYGRSLRGRDLSQFRDACVDAAGSAPHPEVAPDAAPGSNQLEVP